MEVVVVWSGDVVVVEERRGEEEEGFVFLYMQGPRRLSFEKCRISNRRYVLEM